MRAREVENLCGLWLLEDLFEMHISLFLAVWTWCWLLDLSISSVVR